MKNAISILLFFLVIECSAQVCDPNEISTNPSSATNPEPPNSHYINNFNWFQQAANNVLFDIPITSMSDYYPLGAMLNPYNDDNSLCYYLAEANLSDLDMYPEDGWELLFFNLGTYPDGTIYTSESSNIPYILL